MTKENLPIKLDYTNPATIKTLKETVAKGATDSEFAMFAGMCQATGLNPFKREIWFIKTGSGVQMMTGINGFYEIANKHPAYDGCETEVIEEAGKIIKAICRVYRKDRSHPTTAEAYYAEYAKSYGNWKTMPRLMLSKCAESMAHRKAFPQELNGLYTAEEMPGEYSQQNDITENNLKAMVSAVVAEGAKLAPKPEPEPKPEAGLLQAFPGSTVDPQPEFYYDLNKIDPKRKDAAVALIEKAGGRWWQQHDIWVSPVRITKLGRVFCTKAEVEKRDSMPPASYTDAEFDAQRGILDSRGVYEPDTIEERDHGNVTGSKG